MPTAGRARIVRGHEDRHLGDRSAVRRVLLAGATGRLGRQLLADLKQRGHWVRALVRRPEQAARPPRVEHTVVVRPTGFCSDMRAFLGMAERGAVLLLDAAAPAALRALVEALPLGDIACLDVALRRLPRPAYPIVQDLEQPRFMSAQSVYARVAPPGGAVIHAFKVFDPRRPTDPRTDERELEDVLDIAQPGWRDVLVKRFFLPRMAGSTAVPTAAAGGFAGRPDGVVPGVHGLYLAGDWVGPRGFLADASLASARRAAHLVLSQPAAGAEATRPAPPRQLSHAS
jgi:NAD(P)H-binding